VLLQSAAQHNQAVQSLRSEHPSAFFIHRFSSNEVTPSALEEEGSFGRRFEKLNDISFAVLLPFAARYNQAVQDTSSKQSIREHSSLHRSSSVEVLP
jgi:hypothetical protein